MNQETKKNNQSKQQKKKKNRGKTVKKRDSNNNHNKQYYLTNFVNTPMIPFTSIINYINDHYEEYRTLGNKVNQWSFYFDVKDDFISNNKIVNIDQTISKNELMTLDKLLAYVLYSKSKSFFQENGNKIKIEDLKNQIGKDSSRVEILINGDTYQYQNQEENSTNDEKADYFIMTLLEYLGKLGKNIDYNLINKIGISCCQNIFNLLVDQLTITIMEAIHPETCTFLNGKKHIEIIMNEKIKKIKLFFSSNIIISYQQLLDPEYTCGHIDFIFVMDFMKNTYVFEKFVLNYDAEQCNPAFLEQQEMNLQQEEDEKNKYSFLKKHLMKHAAITVASAMITTPFVLGAIGGNKNTKKRKIKKTRKNHS
jgi:hypothetical protein